MAMRNEAETWRGLCVGSTSSAQEVLSELVEARAVLRQVGLGEHSDVLTTIEDALEAYQQGVQASHDGSVEERGESDSCDRELRRRAWAGEAKRTTAHEHAHLIVASASARARNVVLAEVARVYRQRNEFLQEVNGKLEQERVDAIGSMIKRGDQDAQAKLAQLQEVNAKLCEELRKAECQCLLLEKKTEDEMEKSRLLRAQFYATNDTEQDHLAHHSDVLQERSRHLEQRNLTLRSDMNNTRLCSARFQSSPPGQRATRNLPGDPFRCVALPPFQISQVSCFEQKRSSRARQLGEFSVRGRTCA